MDTKVITDVDTKMELEAFAKLFQQLPREKQYLTLGYTQGVAAAQAQNAPRSPKGEQAVS